MNLKALWEAVKEVATDVGGYVWDYDGDYAYVVFPGAGLISLGLIYLWYRYKTRGPRTMRRIDLFFDIVGYAGLVGAVLYIYFVFLLPMGRSTP